MNQLYNKINYPQYESVMMPDITRILFKTPWWVYIVFIYLITRGIQATKDRILSLPQLFIIPCILLIINGLRLVKYPLWSTWGTYGAAIFLGMVVGSCIGSRQLIKVNTQEKTVILPGSYQTLVFLMIVFVSRYLSGYLQATNPILAQQYLLYILGLNGLITGIFLGHRLWCMYLFALKN